MITYRVIGPTGIAVYLDRKRVGTIKKLDGGWQYCPWGQSIRKGDLQTSVAAVKRTLESK